MEGKPLCCVLPMGSGAELPGVCSSCALLPLTLNLAMLIVLVVPPRGHKRDAATPSSRNYSIVAPSNAVDEPVRSASRGVPEEWQDWLRLEESGSLESPASAKGAEASQGGPSSDESTLPTLRLEVFGRQGLDLAHSVHCRG